MDTHRSDDRTNDPAAERPAIPPTMRAVTQSVYGAPDVLRVDEIDVPTPGPDDVLVRVDAAALDRGTWHLVTGLPLLARLESGLRRPKRRIPGFDLAGEVVAIGSGVTELAVGDAVCGFGRGSCAEYALAASTKLARRPATDDPTTLAAFAAVAISGTTALRAVRDRARVAPGSTVLVLGASGGVGTFAVQIARAAGADVTGVCSAAKAALVRSLGATRVIDHATEDALDGSVTYDAIIDVGGRRSFRDLRRALRPRGTVVLVGGEGGNRLTGGFLERIAGGAVHSLFGRHRFVGLIAAERGDDVATLVAMIADGTLQVVVDRVVGLDGVAASLDDLAAGRVRGKVVVRP
jgi:NADPH:quinone reductase-like Zn-dependent oxidoreductase